MTSQYVTEPPTSGLVELLTSKGPIHVELFSRETPLACRNFLTLALEGFYDNLIFHRLIPNFIIQTGDPSGTGEGGESIYGHPFAIEPHSRLKFNRRGLLGMAASAEDKTNESQFFLTLDAAPELQGKHTLMGRVVGNTIYNLIELTQGVEMKDKGGDRPRYPPKLIEVKVIENPFDDLKPRMTKQQRRQEEQNRRKEAEARRKEEEKAKRGKVKKNTSLLSFGADEETGAEEVVLKGPKSSHDLLKDDSRLSKQTVEPTSESSKAKRSHKEPLSASAGEAIPSSPAPLPATVSSSSENSASIEPPRASHRKPTTTSSASAKDYLTAQRAKYASNSASSSSSTNKADAYDALLSFQSRLRSSASSSSTPLPSHSISSHHPSLEDQDEAEEEEEEQAKEYGASDDDTDWRSHRLDAGGAPLLASDQRVDDYEVLDPRDHSAPRKEGERSGKRGRDWVDDTRRYKDDRRPRSDKHSSSSSRPHRHRDHRDHR
ncbi:hypothetical protein EX895_001377 [Sporisorium graminicola]|uniref:PPIase cyclophilin-type domain-containing protein n=1 Tax=Sporisorium graminicola TaxID=280036 RepID=A0A4U7L2Q6_9BASI|nr:hypothetical protein EX895_001377 [Sporisorium graminicola]TKY89592.1 hypothetical protein EX895_001377 [Sporisorium graminicola]